MRRKELLVPVDPATDSEEYKRVESLFLQTLSGGYKIVKVKLRKHFKQAHLLVDCAIVNNSVSRNGVMI